MLNCFLISCLYFVVFLSGSLYAGDLFREDPLQPRFLLEIQFCHQEPHLTLAIKMTFLFFNFAELVGGAGSVEPVQHRVDEQPGIDSVEAPSFAF